MTDTAQKKITRKEFVTRSAAGFVALGLSGYPADSSLAEERKTSVSKRTLGKTGLALSTVGFGASRTEDPSVIKRALDSGVNFIDTGRMYSNGRNEELVGKVIQRVRSSVIVQSKFYRLYLTDSGQILNSIDDSLKALRTDYIDIMLKQSAATKDELLAPAVLEAVTKAKEAGKIKFAGFSAHTNQAEMLREAVKSGFYDVAMVAYNHAGHYTHSVSNDYYEWNQAELEREIENAVKAGMGIIAMKTCSAGRYRKTDAEEESYTAAIAKVLENDNIASAVPAMASFREVDENLRAMA